MSEISKKNQRLTIRVGRGSLSFSCVAENDVDVIYEPFVVKSGISMAANLREAFKQADLLLQAPPRVRVTIDSEVLLVPVENFNEKDIEALHSHAFPRARCRVLQCAAGLECGGGILDEQGPATRH